MTEFACKLGVVVVGPGALKPSDGDGIESRSHCCTHSKVYLLSSVCLFLFFRFSPILVCVIIII